MRYVNISCIALCKLKLYYPSMVLQPFVGHCPRLQFRNPLYTDRMTP
jgi:hypothetical protein